jgi:hypothetical protein
MHWKVYIQGVRGLEYVHISMAWYASGVSRNLTIYEV